MEIISRHLPVGTEEKQKKTHRCGELVSQTRFDPMASRIVEVYSVTARPERSVASEDIQVLLFS
jgi:hypothetical protein